MYTVGAIEIQIRCMCTGSAQGCFDPAHAPELIKIALSLVHIRRNADGTGRKGLLGGLG